MNPATIFSVVTLSGLALILLCTITANLQPGQPFWPTTDHQADLGLGVLALACAFLAGWQL